MLRLTSLGPWLPGSNSGLRVPDATWDIRLGEGRTTRRSSEPMRANSIACNTIEEKEHSTVLHVKAWAWEGKQRRRGSWGGDHGAGQDISIWGEGGGANQWVDPPPPPPSSLQPEQCRPFGDAHKKRKKTRYTHSVTRQWTLGGRRRAHMPQKSNRARSCCTWLAVSGSPTGA